MNAGAFSRHGVNVKCEFENVPEIVVEKHKVLRILINLLRNEKYACEAGSGWDLACRKCRARSRSEFTLELPLKSSENICD